MKARCLVDLTVDGFACLMVDGLMVLMASTMAAYSVCVLVGGLVCSRVRMLEVLILK